MQITFVLTRGACVIINFKYLNVFFLHSWEQLEEYFNIEFYSEKNNKKVLQIIFYYNYKLIILRFLKEQISETEPMLKFKFASNGNFKPI